MGAYGAGAIILAPVLPAETSRWIFIPVMVLDGMAVGAAWGLIPGYLKAAFNVNEIISTLMLNYIAVAWVNFWIFAVWTEGGFQMSPTFPNNAWLPRLLDYSKTIPMFAGLTSHLGLLLGILAAVVLWIVVYRSRWGYEIRLIGDNARAARYAGMNITRNTVMVMMVSGALAGLGGMSEVTGVVHRLQTSPIAAGYGFTGIIVAWLAKLNTLVIIPVSIFFGGLILAGREIQPSGVPKMIQGVILVYRSHQGQGRVSVAGSVCGRWHLRDPTICPVQKIAMKRAAAGALLAWALSLAAHAEPLTLEQALASVTAAHPDRRMAESELALARADRDEAASQQDFNLFLYGALRSGRRFESDNWRADNVGRIVARKPLLDFGRSGQAVAAADLEVAGRQTALFHVDNLRRIDVMARFFDVLLADMQYAADNEFMAVAYVSWDNAKDRLEVGQISQPELLKLQADCRCLERRSPCDREPPSVRRKFAAVMPLLKGVLQFDKPDAAFYLWAQVPGGDDAAFARGLYEKQHVTVLPGSFLARDAAGINPGKGFVRIALVDSLQACVEAAKRMAAFVGEAA